jgi:biotin transport system substrate-specific component
MQRPGRATAIADALIPRSGAWANVFIDATLIVGFAALTGLSAKVAVYLNPAVPITGQTFAVLMSGAVLGSKRGAASMLVYLGTGIAGIPVFAPSGAISGASRGYLLGFVAAALIVGFVVERGWGRNPFKLAAAMLAGEVAIYAFGLSWLAFYIPADAMLDTSRLAVVYDWGLENFIIGDSIKLVLAALGVPLVWEGIRRLKGQNVGA